ncbi:hypothetical protein EB796_016206 [Bugula neritina]|uniref:Uncharacterized protein n=1 Tax=Bugula neritina TaxID=10212 RepID=A0A7J7JGL9_BUGNE|nr:hypothetical protein EB796_016206 [Bugula neritina]
MYFRNSALSGSSTTPAATSTAAAAAAAVINGTVTPPGVLFSSLSENPTSADSKLPLTSGFTTDFPFLDFLKNSKPTDEIDSLFSGLATVPYSDLEDHSSSFVPDIKTLSKLVIDTSGGATTAGEWLP